MERQSLTGKQFWEYCNSDSNADELKIIFRKNFDDRVSSELANAVINILDSHAYSVYQNVKNNGWEQSSQNAENKIKFDWRDFPEEKFEDFKKEIQSGWVKTGNKGSVYCGDLKVDFDCMEIAGNWVQYSVHAFGQDENVRQTEGMVMNAWADNDYNGFKQACERLLEQDFGSLPKFAQFKEAAHRPLRSAEEWATPEIRNEQSSEPSQLAEPGQEKALDPLTEPCKLEVDGLTRTCSNGIQKGLEHTVMVINDLMETNRELVEENKQLEKQIRQLKRSAVNSY